ncbi:MAG: GNAT family N-acyltransferase [Myxococcota bacterium]
MNGLGRERRDAIAGFLEGRGDYQLRYAVSPADRIAVQRLRFEVFARELGASVRGAERGLDEDPLDEIVDHLLVIERTSGACVGTYRLATREQVGRDPGFYSRRQFELGRLDSRIEAEGVELGRACVALRHRKRGVFQMLLRGIAAYLVLAEKRFLFGCGSIRLKDPGEAAYVARAVEAAGWLDPALAVAPTAAYRLPVTHGADRAGPELPPLLHAYCAFGARLAPMPAWDADFSSLDYFVLMDRERMDPRAWARFGEAAR